MLSARLALLVGFFSNQWRKIKEFREGGMARVWLVRRRFAHGVLKQLHSYHLDSPEYIEGMRMECDVLERLWRSGCRSAPRILDRSPVLKPDARTTPLNEVWFVMTFVKGVRLDDAIPNLRSAGERIAVVVAMARALADIHRNGVAHRDLSPENVVIVRSNSRGAQVKLLDFGSAGLETEPHPMDADAVLKPRYAAPEQFSGMAQTRRAADVYSLGLMACEVLLGVHPFFPDMHLQITAQMHKEANRADLARRLVGNETCPLARAVADYLALTVLAIRPEGRQTIEALLDWLEGRE